MLPGPSGLCAAPQGVRLQLGGLQAGPLSLWGPPRGLRAIALPSPVPIRQEVGLLSLH